MSDKVHRLVQINSDPQDGWAGTCTCGRWGFAAAKSKSELKKEHDEHVRNPLGRPR